MEIKLTYRSVDRVTKSRTYKTLAGAAKFIRDWLGSGCELGSGYLVSEDGIGVVELRKLDGPTVSELLAAVRNERPSKPADDLAFDYADEPVICCLCDQQMFFNFDQDGDDLLDFTECRSCCSYDAEYVAQVHYIKTHPVNEAEIPF